MINKRAHTQDEPTNLKVKFDKGSGSQNGKPTYSTCWKQHYGECLKGTTNCFGFGKGGHNVRDIPRISSREKEGNKVT